LFIYSFFLLYPLQANWSSSPTTLDTLLSSPNASSTAALIVDRHGNITAAWLENSIGTAVQASYYSSDLGSWTTPAMLDEYYSAAAQPQLIVDRSGIVTALWLEYLAGSYIVQTARFDGTSWTAPTTLSTDGGVPLSPTPNFVVDLSGHVTVAWFTQQGSTYVIQAARFSHEAWSSPVTLNSVTQDANININPQMVVDAYGNVTVAWTENTGSGLQIEAARFSAGAWTEPTVLNNGTQTPNAYPSIPTSLKMIVDNYGNVTVTWLENSTNPIAVQEAQFSAPPVVAALSPKSGPRTGGTHVIIKGGIFSQATAVLFGSTPATSFTIDSATRITAVAPPGTGVANVRVQTTNGTSASSTHTIFSYHSEHNVHSPSHLKGVKKFKPGVGWINIIKWSPPQHEASIIFYQIYRGSHHRKLIAMIPASAHLRFEDHNRKKEKAYTYSITSVDKHGNVSNPAYVHIKKNS